MRRCENINRSFPAVRIPCSLAHRGVHAELKIFSADRGDGWVQLNYEQFMRVRVLCLLLTVRLADG
jgi:hypothetical protein